MKDRKKSVGEICVYLVEQGVLSHASAAKVRSAAETTSHPLDIILIELGLIDEEAISGNFADFLDIPQIAEPENCMSDELIEQIGIDYFESVTAVPVFLATGELGVATADPVLSDTAEVLAFHLGSPVVLSSASRQKITTVLELFRRQKATHETDTLTPLPIDQLDADDVDRLKDVASEAPIVRLLAGTVQRAVEMNASDIHIEPFDDGVHIRMRCDGVLVLVETAPKNMLAGLATRLKILSRLNIAERRLPQDGRMQMAIRGRKIDLRVSVLPSIHGETFVLRILDRATLPLDLDRLGYSSAAVQKLKNLARLGNGIILVTGPTGSGKTTTLYAMLREMDTQRTKVFTVEDPVEYRFDGITQVQVNTAIELGFARTLRTVLRQDPDVILIGEIRDTETAKIAVRAALTGHLVLSTLHTNSAAGAFARLADMGVEPYLLSDTIRAVIGQRLVRRTCETCHGNSEHCPSCEGSGYRGRAVTYEILEVTPKLLQQSRFWQSEADMADKARAEGFRTLSQHAEELVRTGVTDRRELARVLNSGPT